MAKRPLVEHVATNPKLTASALIANARGAEEIGLPPPEALVELEAIMLHNDTSAPHIKAEDAMELLRSHGWPCARTRFDRLLRRKYGRGWTA